MNRDLKVEALKLRVSPENDNVFNEEFWEDLDFVLTAVDNTQARRFVDSKCVSFLKPLFDSGTLGLKCTSQMVIPFHTQSYGETPDQPSETIPMCTLKNFPYQIEHTIQWARDYFEGIFAEGPNEYKNFIEDPAKFLRTMQDELRRQPNLHRSRLETIYSIQSRVGKSNQKTCIEHAREMFQEIFCNQIAQLIHTFPPDYKNEAGQPFWGGLKKLPKVLNFDPTDETHTEFLFAAANLWAFVLGVPQLKDKKEAAEYAATLKVQTYEPKKVVIKASDTDTVEEGAEDDEFRIVELEQILLENNKGNKENVNAAVFEKDDDANFHIDFISAVANLRARNYRIEEIPKFKVKMIAGKIIPAVATSTAMIVGAVGFEVFKLAAGKEPEEFRNLFCNLAVPRWMFGEIMPPIRHRDEEYNPNLLGPTKAIPSGWTTWDRINVQGPMTLEEIFSYVKGIHNVQNVTISVARIEGNSVYIDGLSKKERLKMTPEEAYRQVKGEPYPASRKYVEIGIAGETDNDVNVLFPPVKYLKAK